jgi:hypothetical protein
MPEKASMVAREIIERGMDRRVVDGISAGIAAHCARVRRALALLSVPL